MIWQCVLRTGAACLCWCNHLYAILPQGHSNQEVNLAYAGVESSSSVINLLYLILGLVGSPPGQPHRKDLQRPSVQETRQGCLCIFVL